jgi:hypothetical protein
MTKTIVLGSDTKKKIELKFVLAIDKLWQCADVIKTNEYAHLELITRNYTTEGYDLIFGYVQDRNNGEENGLFLGFWNDGIV